MKLWHVLPTQLRRTLQLVWDSSPHATIAGGVLMLCQAALSIAGLVLVKHVIDAVSAGLANQTPQDGVGHIAILVTMAALVALLATFCRSADSAIGEIHRDKINDHLLSAVHAKAVDVDVEYYENAEYYNALHRAQSQSSHRAAATLGNLLQFARSAVLLAAIAGLLFTFNWWIAAALVLGDLPGALVRIVGARRLYRFQLRSAPTESRARYFSGLLTTGYSAQEIRIFGFGWLFIERFDALRKVLREGRKQLALGRLYAELAAHLSAILAMYGAYGFVAYQALLGVITIGDLVMYYAAFQRAQGYLQECLFGLARFYEDNLFMTGLSDFLALEQTVVDPPKSTPVPRPFRAGLVLEHVDFHYPGSDRLALKDINFVFRPGERIAIVGQNGSGKTTLVKMLCRLYDPSAGQITVDGLALGSFSKAEWRRQIGVMFQEPGRYAMTARENIWLGSLAPDVDDAPIVQAARGTGAHSVIERLPHGYDTQLRKLFDEGAELSVGEWQKVALARTNLRDAQVLILDEPTAAMDALAEQKVLDTIWTASPGRITILISHRLSMARQADRILVLADGRIVESGTHGALMQSGGDYAALFNAQAHHYQAQETPVSGAETT